MKRNIVLILLVFLAAKSFSQNDFPMQKIKGESFPVFFDNEMRRSYTKKLDTLGINGCCWIKFQLQKNGNIINLEISPGTNHQLSNTLKEIVYATNGLWNFRNEKEWFIIPVEYTLQKNGKSETVRIESTVLNNFFVPDQNTETVYTFLPSLEYVSPFDRRPEPKMKLQGNKITE